MNKEFQVHLLNDNGIEKAKQLANKFDDFLNDINVLCGFKSAEMTPDQGRYSSLVRTKLEEASFFAKKAIAVVPSNQKS